MHFNNGKAAYKNNQQKGFSLLELLLVVAIIGILSAIAIPQYSAYRRTAYDAQVQSDLRTGALAQEASFALGDLYISCSDEACLCEQGLTPKECASASKLFGWSKSTNSEISFSGSNQGNGQDYYQATGKSKKGSGKSFKVDSRTENSGGTSGKVVEE